MWRSLACLLALTTIAHADDLPTIESSYVPYIEIDMASHAGLEAVELDVHSGISWLHLEVFNTGGWGNADPIAIITPAGTRILGMGFSREDKMRWAALEPERPARNVFADSGFALLTQDGQSTTSERFGLHVDDHATIDLAIELPQLARLDIGGNAVISRLAVSVDGARRIDRKHVRDSGPVALTGITSGLDAAPHVDAETSLLVDARNVELPAPPADDLVRSSPALDKRMIRRVLDRHRPQLRRCYTAAVEHAHPTLEGDVTISFGIGGDGKTEDVRTDSTMPDEVTHCLVELVHTLEFPETGDHVLINYPLHFQLSRAPA